MLSLNRVVTELHHLFLHKSPGGKFGRNWIFLLYYAIVTRPLWTLHPTEDLF